MLTRNDQVFLVELSGYVIGTFFAGVIALFIIYKLVFDGYKLVDFISRLIKSIFSKKKKSIEVENN